MNVLWGILLVVISTIGWLGQVLSAFAPVFAARLGLTEAESDVDPAFYADGRGEALWDTLILWTLPLAGVLLLLNRAVWAYFGLVGGGMYLYFSGRLIVAYRTLQRRGIRIGKPGDIRVKYVFLTLWGLTAAVTIVIALAALPLP
jgi:hypothetical protein